jgi:hypothetical protein
VDKKIEINIELLKRLAEIAASALNDTASHKAVKEETQASDSEIQAAAFMFLRLRDGVESGLPESIDDLNEFSSALKNNDFENRFFKQ